MEINGKVLRKYWFSAILRFMEQSIESNNARPTSEDRALARKVLDAWKKARLNDGVQGQREVEPRRRVFRMGNLTGGGLPYPGPRCGRIPVSQTGQEHEEDNREQSFNEASKAY